MKVDRSATETHFASAHTHTATFSIYIHILNSFKIALQPVYILHIVHIHPPHAIVSPHICCRG